jgi:hypothetical protein
MDMPWNKWLHELQIIRISETGVRDMVLWTSRCHESEKVAEAVKEAIERARLWWRSHIPRIKKHTVIEVTG